MRNQHATIQAVAVFDLVSPKSDARSDNVKVDVALAYDSGDPFALQASFDTGHRESPVDWVFGRDLLADGLVGPAGDGDVRVRPSDGNPGCVELELNSPSGYALFLTCAVQLAQFLDQTFELVPPGMEYAWLDLDSALETLLSSEAS